MGDPANMSMGEMKLALQRWRTPQAEVDACLEKDDLVSLYKRQRELSEARCVLCGEVFRGLWFVARFALG
jgi:hypothetical protein